MIQDPWIPIVGSGVDGRAGRLLVRQRRKASHRRRQTMGTFRRRQSSTQTGGRVIARFVSADLRTTQSAVGPGLNPETTSSCCRTRSKTRRAEW